MIRLALPMPSSSRVITKNKSSRSSPSHQAPICPIRKNHTIYSNALRSPQILPPAAASSPQTACHWLPSSTSPDTGKETVFSLNHPNVLNFNPFSGKTIPADSSSQILPETRPSICVRFHKLRSSSVSSPSPPTSPRH